MFCAGLDCLERGYYLKSFSVRWLGSVRNMFWGFFSFFGSSILNAWGILKLTFVPPFYVRRFLEQLYFVVVESTPIVSVAVFFGAMASAVPMLQQLESFNYHEGLPGMVGTTVVYNLGTVLASMIVTGRVCSAMTAELSSMKMTEQLDALKTVNINVVKYLMAPRFWAGVVGFPAVAGFATFSGLMGGYVIARFMGEVPHHIILRNMMENVVVADLYMSYIKTMIIGGMITLSAFYFALRASGGAKGVASATLKAVTTAFLLIVAVDNLMNTVYYAVT